MKKTILIALFYLFIIPVSFSQDIILTRTGDELKAKVFEVTATEIKFTTPEKTDVLQTMPIARVFMIKYENGTKKVFSTQKTEGSPMPAASQSPGNAKSADSPPGQNLYQQGQHDAKIYYHDYKTAGTLTLVTTIVNFPIGIGVAIGTSSSTPSNYTLNYPNASLFNQPEYAKGYTEQAKKIKSGKVWKNFGIGSAVGIAF